MRKSVDPGFWIGLLLFSLLLFASVKCHGQQTAVVDTIPIRYSCIVKTVVTAGAKPKIYVIYKDNKIEDVFTVSKTTYEYIKTCAQCGITPTLGIRVRNGVATGVVRYKKKYRI